MRISSIQLKAVFLLFVFSLSTLVSFACAAGIDMGYNRDHHTIRDRTSSTHHSPHLSGDTKDVANHTAEVSHHEQKDDHTKESSKDDCCRDEAAKFEKSDKISPKGSDNQLQAPCITLIVNRYLITDSSITSLYNLSTRYYIRNHHPPIADVRIAIQSFLI